MPACVAMQLEVYKCMLAAMQRIDPCGSSMCLYMYGLRDVNCKATH